MEKHTKNPDSSKSESLQSLSASSIVILRTETVKSNNSAKNINCVSQSSKLRPLPASHEIDKLISELACMIKRLQDEIVELSRNATQHYSLINTLAKNDDKNTQTFNLIDKTKHFTGCKNSDVDNTVIVGTVPTQPSHKSRLTIDAEELKEGTKNKVNKHYQQQSSILLISN